MNLHIVIMAGGSGTRFWPYSTTEKPKQFLDLTGEGTMLELTVKRLQGLVENENIWVMTGEAFCDLVHEQCPDIPQSQIIGEPMMRDTSAAIALAAGLVENRDPDSVMVVLPADHVIRDVEGFHKTLKKAVALAEQGEVVTIGIKPSYAAEIYGYLEQGQAKSEEGCFALESFVEKPSREKAESYIASGRYNWNAGMFVWPLAELLGKLEIHLPEHAKMARTLGENHESAVWMEKAKEVFSALDKVSIDYGLMEKLESIAMVEAEFDWNDVGGWLALEDLLDQDENGNTLQGANVVRDVKNNIVITQNKARPTLVSGVSDCIIVNADVGTLVCHRNEIERIKDLVEAIRKLG